MSTVYFITHPDVVIDPATPVTQWPLSQRGRMRMVKMLENHWLSRVGAIYCSTEQKAIDGAAIISEALGIPYTTIPELGENDRSATGYLPEPEFDPVVDEFFRSPEESVRGWERAVDAQQRIIADLSLARVRRYWWSDQLCSEHHGRLSPTRDLRRKGSEGREARRPTRPAADPVRAGGQYQDRPGARPRRPAVDPRPR